MIPRLAFSLAASFLFSGAQRAQDPAMPDESYEIYSTLIRSEIVRPSPGYYIAIVSRTSDWPAMSNNLESCLKLDPQLTAAYREQIEDYHRKNRTCHKLERKFELGFGYLFVSSNRAPHKGLSVYTVSTVGFNRGRTRALVYLGDSCGPLCGGGNFHVLVKANGKWETDPLFPHAACGWVT